MARSPRGEVELRYTSCEGKGVVTTLDRAPAQEVVRGLPVRRFGWHAGMGHYPGWLWSATMLAHVGYESLLERDRLMPPTRPRLPARRTRRGGDRGRRETRWAARHARGVGVLGADRAANG